MSNGVEGERRAAAEAYRRRVLGLLGDRDPMGVMRQTPAVLSRIMEGRPAAELHARPFPDKWTPCEIIGHLADVEWTYGFRTRLILAEDEPCLTAMDQEKWAVALRHNEADPAALLDGFRSLRAANLALWSSLTPQQLQRTGRHNERGLETLDLILRLLAGHDLAHVDQLERYLHAIQAQ